jgi:hypothetical protein
MRSHTVKSPEKGPYMFFGCSERQACSSKIGTHSPMRVQIVKKYVSKLETGYSNSLSEITVCILGHWSCIPTNFSRRVSDRRINKILRIMHLNAGSSSIHHCRIHFILTFTEWTLQCFNFHWISGHCLCPYAQVSICCAYGHIRALWSSASHSRNGQSLHLTSFIEAV